MWERDNARDCLPGDQRRYSAARAFRFPAMPLHSRHTPATWRQPIVNAAPDPVGLPQGTTTNTQEQIRARYNALVASGRIEAGGWFGRNRRRVQGGAR
jgi:hypothetical protein